MTPGEQITLFVVGAVTNAATTLIVWRYRRAARFAKLAQAAAERDAADHRQRANLKEADAAYWHRQWRDVSNERRDALNARDKAQKEAATWREAAEALQAKATEQAALVHRVIRTYGRLSAAVPAEGARAWEAHGAAVVALAAATPANDDAETPAVIEAVRRG